MANFLNRYIMRHLFPVFLLIVVGLLIAPFLKAQSHADKILKDEITSDLKENILSFWEKYSVDPSGGFYGSLGRDGAPIADAPKGGRTELPASSGLFSTALSDVWRCCLPQTG